MSKYDDIVKKSKESYDRFFKDFKYLPENEEVDGVSIDVKDMESKVKEKAAQAEGHMKAIEQVKKELEDEATQAEQKTFKDEAEKAKTDLNKMYDEYVDAQKKLFSFEQKLAEKVHEIHEEK